MKFLSRRLFLLAPGLPTILGSACGGRVLTGQLDTGSSEGGAADTQRAEAGPRSVGGQDAAHSVGGRDGAIDGNGAKGALDDCPLPPPSTDGGTSSDAGCLGEVTDAGGCLVTLATEQDNPTGLAVRGDTVVWGNSPPTPHDGSIVRVGTSGGTPVTLASHLYVYAYDTIGVTLDDTYVYWASSGVARAPLAGGPVNTLYDDDNSDVLFPIRAGDNVYFVETQFAFGFFSVSTVGTGFTGISTYDAEVAAASSSSTGLVYSVSSDMEGVPGRLISLPCGGTPSTLYTEPSGELGLVASAGEVVVFIKGSVGTGNLVSIPLEGGTVRLLVRDVYADSLATDGASVYWTDESREAVMKLDLASGAPVALARYNGIGSIVGETALALDATSVYWTSPSACSGTCGGAVMKLTPR